MAYDDRLLAGLEWMWGEGFMSPGGPGEVAEILRDVELAGTRVLDIGCGLGGIDLLLLERYHAATVCGIDIEPALVARARATAARRGLSERLRLEVVEPGPLPFADASFERVFSKDSIIHVEDKLSLYREVYRLLTPGGVFVGSDWLGADTPHSEQMRAWLDVVHLDFALATAAEVESWLRRAGFAAVRLRDRNEWYRRVVREELASVSGENQARLAERLGEVAAAHRQQSSQAKLLVVDSGELRPTHFIAYKQAG